MFAHILQCKSCCVWIKAVPCAGQTDPPDVYVHKDAYASATAFKLVDWCYTFDPDGTLVVVPKNAISVRTITAPMADCTTCLANDTDTETPTPGGDGGTVTPCKFEDQPWVWIPDRNSPNGGWWGKFCDDCWIVGGPDPDDPGPGSTLHCGQGGGRGGGGGGGPGGGDNGGGWCSEAWRLTRLRDGGDSDYYLCLPPGDSRTGQTVIVTGPDGDCYGADTSGDKDTVPDDGTVVYPTDVYDSEADCTDGLPLTNCDDPSDVRWIRKGKRSGLDSGIRRMGANCYTYDADQTDETIPEGADVTPTLPSETFETCLDCSGGYVGTLCPDESRDDGQQVNADKAPKVWMPAGAMKTDGDGEPVLTIKAYKGWCYSFDPADGLESRPDDAVQMDGVGFDTCAECLCGVTPDEKGLQLIVCTDWDWIAYAPELWVRETELDNYAEGVYDFFGYCYRLDKSKPTSRISPGARVVRPGRNWAYCLSCWNALYPPDRRPKGIQAMPCGGECDASTMPEVWVTDKFTGPAGSFNVPGAGCYYVDPAWDKVVIPDGAWIVHPDILGDDCDACVEGYVATACEGQDGTPENVWVPQCASTNSPFDYNGMCYSIGGDLVKKPDGYTSFQPSSGYGSCAECIAGGPPEKCYAKLPQPCATGSDCTHLAADAPLQEVACGGSDPDPPTVSTNCATCRCEEDPTLPTCKCQDPDNQCDPDCRGDLPPCPPCPKGEGNCDNPPPPCIGSDCYGCPDCEDCPDCGNNTPGNPPPPCDDCDDKPKANRIRCTKCSDGSATEVYVPIFDEDGNPTGYAGRVVEIGGTCYVANSGTSHGASTVPDRVWPNCDRCLGQFWPLRKCSDDEIAAGMYVNAADYLASWIDKILDVGGTCYYVNAGDDRVDEATANAGTVVSALLNPPDHLYDDCDQCNVTCCVVGGLCFSEDSTADISYSLSMTIFATDTDPQKTSEFSISTTDAPLFCELHGWFDDFGSPGNITCSCKVDGVDQNMDCAFSFLDALRTSSGGWIVQCESCSDAQGNPIDGTQRVVGATVTKNDACGFEASGTAGVKDSEGNVIGTQTESISITIKGNLCCTDEEGNCQKQQTEECSGDCPPDGP